jgi:hypothetical protein
MKHPSPYLPFNPLGVSYLPALRSRRISYACPFEASSPLHCTLTSYETAGVAFGLLHRPVFPHTTL